jgi:hypothetical protein
MVYLLSVVSVYGFVLVVDWVRRGGIVESKNVTCCDGGKPDVGGRRCAATK